MTTLVFLVHAQALGQRAAKAKPHSKSAGKASSSSKPRQAKTATQNQGFVNDAHARAKADSIAAFTPARKPISADKELVQKALCNCFTRVKDKPDAPSQKISDCMLEAYRLEQEAFAGEYGHLTEDAAENNRIGEIVGNDLAPRCPAFVSVVADQIRKQEEGKR